MVIYCWFHFIVLLKVFVVRPIGSSTIKSDRNRGKKKSCLGSGSWAEHVLLSKGFMVWLLLMFHDSN